jgi:hypothetical protein
MSATTVRGIANEKSIAPSFRLQQAYMGKLDSISICPGKSKHLIPMTRKRTEEKHTVL